MANKIKVGIIGCGGIANGKHLPALSHQSHRLEIVAFCDIIKERAEKAAKEYGTPDAKVYTDYKEMLTINIELKSRNKIQKFFHTTQSKLEDLLFSIIQKLPEPLIPSFLINWIESYINKRTKQLQQEIIRQQWQQIHLEKAVEEIHENQNKKKAP